MANPLTNERELYDRIKNERISVPLAIWDLIYHYLCDDIAAIAQITLSHLRYGKPIPPSDAKKILEHTKKINATVRKILQHDKIENAHEQLEEWKGRGAKLHPIINELFFHHIGNDVYGISMIAGFHVDPMDEHPIPVEDAQKILDKASSMTQFMDRLREATHQESILKGKVT